MRRAASRQIAKPVQADEPAGDRVAERVLEPADRPGADARQHRPVVAPPAAGSVQPPLAPQRQHRLGVAAADVDHVLRHQETLDVGGVRAEQRQVRRRAVQRAKRLIKAQRCSRRCRRSPAPESRLSGARRPPARSRSDPAARLSGSIEKPPPPIVMICCIAISLLYGVGGRFRRRLPA